MIADRGINPKFVLKNGLQCIDVEDLIVNDQDSMRPIYDSARGNPSLPLPPLQRGVKRRHLNHMLPIRLCRLVVLTEPHKQP